MQVGRPFQADDFDVDPVGLESPTYIMKIYRAELRHVRQIKELILDLAAPLTVIAGPNGVGKTTVQQAILAAMFHVRAKETRDSFISRFDPDTPPTVSLTLSHDGASPAIVLSRSLTDDKGEWREGDKIFKKKGQALEEVQKVLPISADAAALLLWGRQDDMAAIVDDFPADGYALLTNATIKGAGPDPKEIIAQLDKAIEQAKKGERGGKEVGGLTSAGRRLTELEEELAKARAAEQELQRHKSQFVQAKSERDRITAQARELETAVAKLERLDKLLAQALQDAATLSGMVEKETDQENLEGEIEQACKALTELQEERARLQCHHRVARDRELARQAEQLRARIAAAEELQSACVDLEKDVASRKRPEANDVKRLRELQTQIKQIEARIEATGVRYELSLASGAREVRLVEDGTARKIRVAEGAGHGGIVGRLEIDIDGLRLSAAGKEDIAGHRKALTDKSAEVQALLDKFAAAAEAALLALADEKNQLALRLADKRSALRVSLGAATLPSLQADLDRVVQARLDNRMTLEDEEACAGKDLPTAADIDNRLSRKDGEIEAAEGALDAGEKKRPTDLDKRLLKANLDAFRKKARESGSAFKDADESGREPTRELQSDLRRNLEAQRAQQGRLQGAVVEAERRASGLEGQLRQTAPHRSIEAIESELRDARAALHRQQVLQDARALLKQRIEQKINDLAAHVPVDLGNRVTQHLSRLTGGLFDRVHLSHDLGVAHVSENGASSEQWQPHHLSYGERHQAALAVKIAVARALAETSGPIFIILDDSLVTFDPLRRATTEELLLELVADGKLQAILLTCHTDWAADWKRRRPDQVNFIELAKAACYYRARHPAGSPATARLA